MSRLEYRTRASSGTPRLYFSVPRTGQHSRRICKYALASRKGVLSSTAIGGGHSPIPLVYTPYHAAYYAHELTRKSASDDPNKLGASLYSATVDLNPHQVDAALFAFRSPLSRGAILADEVGLGKTIEAGLLISQLWAERKRRILVICPTILRKQWAQELSDKFHLESLVLDGKEFNARTKQGQDPLTPNNQVVICSYNFVQAKEIQVLAV